MHVWQIKSPSPGWETRPAECASARSRPGEGLHALTAALGALAFALVLVLFSHVVACASDDDHVSTVERAGKNAVLLISVRDPDRGPDRFIVPADFPNVAGIQCSDTATSVPTNRRAHGCISRNSAIAHLRTAVLLI